METGAKCLSENVSIFAIQISNMEIIFSQKPHIKDILMNGIKE